MHDLTKSVEILSHNEHFAAFVGYLHMKRESTIKDLYVSGDEKAAGGKIAALDDAIDTAQWKLLRTRFPQFFE